MGYHTTKIEKGIVGEVSKIKEEFLELEDAISQDAKVMVLCELSDICGAIESYLEKHHPSITIEDLVKMSRMTASAFRDGDR